VQDDRIEAMDTTMEMEEPAATKPANGQAPDTPPMPGTAAAGTWTPGSSESQPATSPSVPDGKAEDMPADSILPDGSAPLPCDSATGSMCTTLAGLHAPEGGCAQRPVAGHGPVSGTQTVAASASAASANGPSAPGNLPLAPEISSPVGQAMLVSSSGKAVALDAQTLQQIAENSQWHPSMLPAGFQALTTPSKEPQSIPGATAIPVAMTTPTSVSLTATPATPLLVTPTLAMASVSLATPTPNTPALGSGNLGPQLSSADEQAIAALTALGNGDHGTASGREKEGAARMSLPMQSLLAGAAQGGLQHLLFSNHTGQPGTLVHAMAMGDQLSCESPVGACTPGGSNSGVNSRHGAARGRQVTRSCPGCGERISIACKLCSLCGHKFRGGAARDAAGSSGGASTGMGEVKEEPAPDTPVGAGGTENGEGMATPHKGDGMDDGDGSGAARPTVTRVTPNSLELHKIKEQERRAREKNLLAKLQALLFDHRDKLPSASEVTYNFVLESAVAALRDRDRRRQGLAPLGTAGIRAEGESTEAAAVSAGGVGGRADMEKHKIKEQQRRARKRLLLSVLQGLVVGCVPVLLGCLKPLLPLGFRFGILFWFTRACTGKGIGH